VRKPHYILFCLVTILVGCSVGAIWFELALAVKDGTYRPFALLPLTIFDSFLVGWFPALFFGALLHFSMQKMRWFKLWQWMLGGGFLAWVLFWLGAWIGKADVAFFTLLLLGVTLLKNMMGHAWPAAISGGIVSAILWCVASKLAAISPAAVS